MEQWHDLDNIILFVLYDSFLFFSFLYLYKVNKDKYIMALSGRLQLLHGLCSMQPLDSPEVW